MPNNQPWTDADTLRAGVEALRDEAESVDGEPVDEWYAQQLSQILESDADRWAYDVYDVLVDPEGRWWHVSERYVDTDTGDRLYYLWDGNHTGDRYCSAEWVEERDEFEAAGWSTNTKPAHERGYRVNGMLCEPVAVDRWRGNPCVSDHNCENCGETTEGEADILVNLDGQERTAVWIECAACGETTEIEGDTDDMRATPTGRT